MTRTLAELAVALKCSPSELLELDASWIATLIDVLTERSGK